MVLCALGACGQRYPAPLRPADDAAFSPPVSVELAGISNDAPFPMQLMPGDVVGMSTISAETTEYEGLIVDSMGLLHVPLAGDIEVGGLSLTEAEGRIEQALRRFDRIIRVNLSMSEPNGHRATVLGAVTEPGVVSLTPGMRLADLIGQVGGVLREVQNAESVTMADLAGARLVRNGEALPVSLTLAIEGNPRHNVFIHPGDHLYVPPREEERIRVLGEVGAPLVVNYRSGIRLSDALAMAGGLTESGDPRDVRVIRGPLDRPRVFEANIIALARGRGGSHDVELAPGDIVFVTPHGLASLGRTLNALGPILSAATSAGITSAVIISNQRLTAGGTE